MVVIHEWLTRFWHWFWYYRRGKIRYKVFDCRDSYMAMVTDGKTAVWNCYGSTPEKAKEMAHYRMLAYEKEE
jgi:hypothetical protein